MNKIICGDSLKIMRTMPDESIDAVITSPPYNLSNSTGKGFKYKDNSGRWKNAKLRNGYDNYSDNIPRDEYVSWQRECITEMLRLIKPTGAIFYNNKRRVQGGLALLPDDIIKGFPLRQIIIWDRGSGLNFNEGYFVPCYEEIYLIAKPKFKLDYDAAKFGNVWRIAPELKNPHPAPFPFKLPERIIISLPATSHKKVILDPFCGSGTTLLAAKMYGCDYLGIDLSPKYCQDAEIRLSKANSIEQYL